MPVLAESNLDSLRNIWNDPSQPDSIRLMAIGNFAYDGYLFSRPDSAFYYAQLQYDMAEALSRKDCMADALRTQGMSHAIRSHHEEALIYFNSSIDIYREIKNDKGVASILNAFGNIYTDQANYDQALESFKKSVVLYEGLGDKDGMATTLGNIGNIYHETGKWNEALKYFNMALMLNEETGNKRGIASILGALGALHEYQNDFDKAVEYYDRSIKIYAELGDDLGIASILNRMGNVNTGRGDFDKAHDQFTQSLAINQDMEIESGIAYCYYNMGIVCEYQGDFEEALEFTQKGLKIGEEINFVSIQISSLSQMGSIHFNQGEFESAISFASEALNMAQEYGILQHIMSSSEVLYKCYKTLGKYKKALEMHELSAMMQDSIMDEEKQRAIIRQEYQFAYHQEALADSIVMVAREYKTEMAHQAEMRQKNRFKNVLLYSGIFALMLAGALWSRIRWIRRANARLEKEIERAERSEKFKQQFLANMSHEIRTPMNAVLGMTNLTLDTTLNEKQSNYLKAIRKSSQNLLVILNDILDLSKLEAGKMELENIPFLLTEQIHQVHDTLRFKAEEKGLLFESNISEYAPAIIVGDPTRLIQILLNLCGNAIKFTEKGSVKIEVDIVKGTVATIQFKVIDTGIGIPKEKLNSLFDAFQQLDASTSRQYGGTGLGLSISKSLVERQGGSMNIESQYGNGSVFSFTIPYAPPNQKQIASISDHHRTDTRTLSGIRILLAEDNEYNRIVVNDTLENLISDLTIHHAENGKLAIDLLERNEYDLIIMDANMPEMNGLAATRFIRKNLNSSKRDIPIIALTAGVLKADIQNYIDAGMNAYIPKPFKREELIGTLARFYSNPSISKRELPDIIHLSNIRETVKPEKINGTVTDMGFLNEFCNGDAKQMKKYIEIYLKTTRVNLSKIEKAIESDDLQSLKLVIHTMKPQLAMMGMKRSEKWAAELEEMISKNDAKEELFQLARQIESDCEKSLIELT